MKDFQVYKNTFNKSFMMNKELKFSLARNDFGQSYDFKLLKTSFRNEFQFNAVNFGKLLNIVTFPAS